MQTSTLPIWLQATAAVTAVLLALGSALAWFRVMWPAIRNQERRAREMEEWLKSPEAREIFSAARATFLKKLDGLPASTRESFAESKKGVGEL